MTFPKVKIFARENTSRLCYSAGIIIGDILGLPWEVVTDRRKLGKSPVINYSEENIKGSFRISPSSLLFESGINIREITISTWNNLPVFFQTNDGSDFPFDIFAASFYMVTRYEEYPDHQPDEHGRFRASSSLAYKNGFLERPVVDLWAKEFSKSFLKKYPTLAFRRNEFRALLTIDSDQPYAYLGKNILTSVAGLFRDITNNKHHVSDRYRVVKHELKDPYEVYDYILENIEKYKPDTRFFFPTGDHSKYDKNPSWKSREYRDLINRIASRFSFGIHPSYFAADKYGLMEAEFSRLKAITGKEITAGRYHFIRLFLPDSYRNLARLGITEDYSMGFPEEPGFRAGIARPYFFYDLAEERQTGLKIVPFQVMDGTLFQYKKLDHESAGEVIFRLMNETRKVGGLFVSLWHNTSLLETPEWAGWRKLFERMLKEQQS
ncbi:MAG: polysaccharide deacetylase family protein [Bacteroidia bacterium]|nr:polysaccharide deacetylase family protein [Bacteroidia bacterium]